MVEFKEAVKLAKRYREDVDTCIETPNTYIFTRKSEETTLGGISPVVVIKETGKCLDYMGYMCDKASKNDDEIRRFTFS